MSSETMSVRAQRTRAALNLRSVIAAAAVTAAAAVIAIGVAPRLAALIGGSVLLVAGFAVMAPCQLQMALTLSAVLKRRHRGEPSGEAVAVARPTSEFAFGYLAFYAPIATVLGVIAHLLGSWAWVAIIVGAAGSAGPRSGSTRARAAAVDGTLPRPALAAGLRSRVLPAADPRRRGIRPLLRELLRTLRLRAHRSRRGHT